jgi:hypothetical protein
VLAQQHAGRFEEWLAEQRRYRKWSLQAALLEWLYDDAIPWTCGSYELYLQQVIFIILEWTQNKSRFTYQLEGKGEVKLRKLNDDWGIGWPNLTWECLRRDQYERALFLWRKARSHDHDGVSTGPATRAGADYRDAIANGGNGAAHD